ncbi:MAG: hypothetical protein NT049_00615 [Planctomycetota bacterium]|nr:hypothetical protein [Planctomycetota bacterium]
MVEHRFRKAVPESRKSRNTKDLGPAAAGLSAPVQRAGENIENAPQLPPELAQVAIGWQHMPEAVRAGILAMVSAAAASGVATGKRLG